jgi:thioredoxin reductase
MQEVALMSDKFPVAVLGAGPVGLAAAAHLSERHIPFVVFEAGEEVGAALRLWGHVRLFSPWRFDIDGAAIRLLEASGWRAPALDGHPTGSELVEHYLTPLAQLDVLARTLRLGRRVIGVTRLGVDKVRDDHRADRPFVVTTDGAAGIERTLVRAVIDSTGTWSSPNPLGAEGLPAAGEREAADSVSYGIPDVLGAARDRYAGRRVAVVGSGHSAQNSVRDLSMLALEDPGTDVTWIVRRSESGEMFGGSADDQLPERGNLGADARSLVDGGSVRLETGFRTVGVGRRADGVILRSLDARELGPFDEIVAATGFRPDLTFLRELRLDLDPGVESTRALAPLIDPNVHSCGTVAPHGAAELVHPESDVYLIGSKSYGRAPTFLLATGYEQARSVVAELAGDHQAARRVELVLPETGVCGANPAGPPVVVEPAASACCRPLQPAVAVGGPRRKPVPAAAASRPSSCCG